MLNSRTIFSALLILFIAGGCIPVQNQMVDGEPQPVVLTPTAHRPLSTVTPTPLSTATLVPTAEPSSTPTPSVRVTAVNGNLHIRRGPGTAYDRVSLLKSGTSAVIIGQDMLSKWVQIQIPNTEYTGWVSLLTPFSRIEGDLKSIPAFTFTEWPKPAYIKNCTEHDIIILPNELYLYSLWTNANYLNVVQVDPGVYQIQDATLPDAPVYDVIDIREGQTYYITVNGLDEYHNCPEDN